MEKIKNKIKSFHDLEVYQKSYKASIIVNRDLLQKLPSYEKYDLVDQARRASKAIPRLIAEGFAKKHQPRGFIKYLDDALAESNEMIVCISHCKDIYKEYVDIDLCEKLISFYNISSEQIFRLRESWRSFSENRTNNQKP